MKYLRRLVVSTLCGLLLGCNTANTIHAQPDRYFPMVPQQFTMVNKCVEPPLMWTKDHWALGPTGDCGKTYVSYRPVPIGSGCSDSPSLAKLQTKSATSAYWQPGYPGAWDSEIYARNPDGSVVFTGFQGGESREGRLDLIPEQYSVSNVTVSAHGAPILPSYSDQRRVENGETVTYVGVEDTYIRPGILTYECLQSNKSKSISSFQCNSDSCVLREQWKAVFHMVRLHSPAYSGPAIASDLYERNLESKAETHYFAPGLGLAEIDVFDRRSGKRTIFLVREK